MIRLVLAQPAGPQAADDPDGARHPARRGDDRGTYVLTDQINAAFEDIFTDAATRRSTSVAPRKAAFGSVDDAGRPLPERLVEHGARRRRRRRGRRLGHRRQGASWSSTARWSRPGRRADARLLRPPPDRSTRTQYRRRAACPSAPGEVAVIQKHGRRARPAASAQRVGLITDAAAPSRSRSSASSSSATSARSAARPSSPPPSPTRSAGSTAGPRSPDRRVGRRPASRPTSSSRRIRAAVPAYVKVKTGEQAAADQTKEIADAIGAFLTPGAARLRRRRRARRRLHHLQHLLDHRRPARARVRDAARARGDAPAGAARASSARRWSSACSPRSSGSVAGLGIAAGDPRALRRGRLRHARDRPRARAAHGHRRRCRRHRSSRSWPRSARRCGPPACRRWRRCRRARPAAAAASPASRPYLSRADPRRRHRVLVARPGRPTSTATAALLLARLGARAGLHRRRRCARYVVAPAGRGHRLAARAAVSAPPAGSRARTPAATRRARPPRPRR